MTKGTVRTLVPLAAAWFAAGCATTIAQDAKTGPDGKAKGAKKIRLGDDGEGSGTGIVTYPGGDRVDWKVFEIPKTGDIEIALRWIPPRSGEDLSFNVLDDTFHVKYRAKPSTDEKVKKSTTLSGVPAGKYYVQIYASTRGDAGEYTLNVKWTETRATVVATGDPLPNPPRLAAVPGVVAATPGTPGTPNPAKPKGSAENPCAPNELAVPACQVGTAVFTNPACPTAPPMPMGTPCPPQPVINPACPEAGPLLPGAPCPPVIVKKQAKIIERQIAGANEITITLDKGQNQGIAKGWTGVVLSGKAGSKPLGKSEFQIFKVTENESYGKIKGLPINTFDENVRVELTSPPPK